MIARASQLFLPTLRDAPADAEAVSHKLLVRGGFIRQVTRGRLDVPAARLARAPEGRADHPRGDGRDRLPGDADAGADAGRAVGGRPGATTSTRSSTSRIAPGAEYVLPMTHEETVTFHARELQSYKELPQIWYHFAIKERDEPRPRGGLLRVREFIMKDAYSFDRDEDGLDDELRAQPRRLPPDLRALRARGYEVEAESRDDGRQVESFDFLAPSGAGENTLVTLRERRLRRRPRDRARRPARARASRRRSARRRRSRRPGVTTMRGARGVPRASTSPRRRRRCRSTKDDGTVVLALVRGDDRLERGEAAARARRGRRGRRPTRRSAPRSAPSGGSLGPVGFAGEVVADETLREGQFVAGANRDGWHLRGVEAGRDFEPRFADLREPREGDRCPNCGGALRFQTAIEVGHIFKLRHAATRSRSARRSSTRTGKEKPLLGGSYGIGPGARDGGGRRAAPRRERDHLARVDRAVRRARRRARRAPRRSATQAAEALDGAGCDVLLDDRDLRPGEKFADADLIGIPIRVTVGQEEPRGRRGRRPRPRDRRGAACERRRPGQGVTDGTKRRRYSVRAVRPGGRAADGRDGRHLPRPRREDRPVGRAT